MTIPFANFLNVRTAYGASFSHDSKHLAFLTNITGLPQLWRLPADGGWPDQLTFGQDRVMAAWCNPRTAHILFARDSGGNENAQLFLIGLDGADECRLTHDDGAMHTCGGWSPDGQFFAFTANRRNRGRYDLYVQSVAEREARLVWQNDAPGILAPLAFSPDGHHVLISFLSSLMNVDLYEITLADGTARCLTPHSGDARYTRGQYAHNGQSVYCLCDPGREFTGLYRIARADLSLTPVVEADWDVETFTLSATHLAWVTNVDGMSTLTLRSFATGTERTAPGLPAGVIAPEPPDNAGLVFNRTDAPTRLAFSFTSSARTVDVWTWQIDHDRVWPVTQSSHAGIPRETFVEPTLIHYPSFDGREIPAWFFHPHGETSAPRPVVIHVHGGPESQTVPMFFPVHQYLLHRGYAVLSPNVRGSTGYGKSYSHLDDVEKRMDSVADLAHAVYWLRHQPGIDATRIAVYGGSYGGFMVLAALTHYPDLWAAGVEVVGISNLVTFLENTSAYRRSAREAEYGSLARDRAFLERISPIHHVDAIRAPLMIIHGANDPRVPLGEAQQMVAALNARQVPVELLVYHDEGHGLVKLSNRLDAYPKLADFLDRHLKNPATH